MSGKDERTCPNCGGTGTIGDGTNDVYIKCQNCGGTGTVPK